ncbi:MAG TPA: hypothetical protein VNK41_00160 [Vicinamibacterales bacterium]|nr:hypothetical protein [Vicinamibacterales bacterium]
MSHILPSRDFPTGKWRLRLTDDDWDVPTRVVSWGEELAMIAVLAAMGGILLLLI